MARARVRAFIAGVVVTLLLLVGGAAIVVKGGYIDAAADNKPSAFEKRTALGSLHTYIRKQLASVPSPPPNADLIDGVKVYGAQCAICHGTSDGKPSIIARGLNVDPPQFAKDDVTDDPDAETYWKVEHGIRFTAMPAFGKALTEAQIWNVTEFLKHQDKLPPAVEAAWKALPSQAAAQSDAPPSASPSAAPETASPAPTSSGGAPT